MRPPPLTRPAAHGSHPSGATPSLRSKLLSTIVDKVRMLAVLVLLASVAGYLGSFHWSLELFSHFRVQYLASALLILVLLLGLRDFRGSALALLCVAMNGAVVLPAFFGAPRTQVGAEATNLRVLLSNVLSSNTDSAKVLELIRAEAPDIVVMEEVTERWATDLQPLSTTFPYSRILPRPDNFGIALWSRLPLTGVEELTFTETDIPSLHVQVEIAGQLVTLLATHPLPPIGRDRAQDRNAHLAAVAGRLHHTRTPTILIGDLNVTMWSPYFSTLLRETGLVDCRKGRGVLPTYPAQMPVFMIPLDQCLVSPEMGVRAVRTGPQVGSDHLPLIVDLAVTVPR